MKQRLRSCSQPEPEQLEQGLQPPHARNRRQTRPLRLFRHSFWRCIASLPACLRRDNRTPVVCNAFDNAEANQDTFAYLRE